MWNQVDIFNNIVLSIEGINSVKLNQSQIETACRISQSIYKYVNLTEASDMTVVSGKTKLVITIYSFDMIVYSEDKNDFLELVKNSSAISFGKHDNDVTVVRIEFSKFW